MTGTITFNNGRTFAYKSVKWRDSKHKRPFELDGRRLPNITALRKEIRALVLANCDHSINTHSSFRSAKQGRCSKCLLLVNR